MKGYITTRIKNLWIEKTWGSLIYLATGNHQQAHSYMSNRREKITCPYHQNKYKPSNNHYIENSLIQN